ncbi:MAG: PepSY domain-containing protein [Planctomycetota bacterium]|jgi:uncharacterized iron-regulated membrane protein
MSWSRRIRTTHRWISVVIGLQLLMWTSSGLVFTLDAIDVVRGEAFLRAPEAPAAPALGELVSAEVAAAASGLDVVGEARLTWLRDGWVWALTPPAAPAGAELVRPVLVDARDGERLPDLSPDAASAVARARFTPAGAIVAVERVPAATGEYRDKPMPAWRVTFDDERGTNVYVDARTGEITSVRNDTWRRFDFFWMLHIMDYTDRTDFHHPLLTSAAVLGVCSALTGLCLAAVVLRPRRSRARGA